MNELFGTDGVRGVANQFLTPELAYALGRAGAFVLTKGGTHRPVVVGRDTRLSGPMLEHALCAGVASVGLSVWRLGIVPTPAVAFLSRHLKASAGVMISASHNPIEDNGIKFFAADGRKLPDALEDEIAAHVAAHDGVPRPTGVGVGTVLERRRAVEAYVQHCIGLGSDLSGKTVVVDGAYGAAYALAPRIFAALGAAVVPINCKPDGRRINVACGATHLEPLRAAVLAHAGSVGVAFDGDADRALFVDERGDVVSGDHVLAIWARELKSRGELAGDAVVATVMSNVGLELSLRDAGVGLVRTAVGDRYVLEAMLAGGYRLGGEQSGHVIDLSANTTGDGIATAVHVLSMTRGTTLAGLAACLTNLPQILVNVRVGDKDAAQSRPAVQAAIDAAQRALAGRGRILVRPSGTEPLVRIMIEGDDEAEMRTLAAGIERALAAP